MKHLLLSSIIAMLAVPAFADTVTTLPNNALCNETNLGTERGSADIEVVWEPNTINTQWFTGYGENTAAASATTCEYGGTINLPQTNPSRPGYAFAGWKLRAPTVPSNPLANLDTSIHPIGGTIYKNNVETAWANCSISGCIDEELEEIKANMPSFGLDTAGTAVGSFSYGAIYIESSCNTTNPGNSFNLVLQINGGNTNFNTATRPSDTFTNQMSGSQCWCRVYGYTPLNGSFQTTNTPWLYLMDFGESCDYTECVSACGEIILGNDSDFVPLRQVIYGQQ